MKKIILAALTVAAVTIPSSIALAEDVSLHLEPGLAMAAGSPQAGTFRPGMTGSAKLLFPVFTPNLAVGPSASVFSLEEESDHMQNATLWAFGVTARVQGNHDGVVTPWVDATGSVDKQASLYRPGLATAIGLSVPMDQSHTFAMGPWVGYQHIFDNSFKQATALLPHKDANVLMVGWSISFDAPVKPKVVVHTTVVEKVVVKTVTADVPTTTTVTPTTPDMDGAAVLVSQSVMFEKDSAALSAEAQSFLGLLAGELNDNSNLSAIVEGYASSEGDALHNLAISQLRAVSVVDYLVNKGGVARTRLTAVSLGAVGDPNDAHNRRADIVGIRLVKGQ